MNWFSYLLQFYMSSHIDNTIILTWVYVFVRVCVRARLCECVCVCVCMSCNNYTTHTRTRTSAHPDTHTQKHTHTDMHAHTHAHTTPTNTTHTNTSTHRHTHTRQTKRYIPTDIGFYLFISFANATFLFLSVVILWFENFSCQLENYNQVPCRLWYCLSCCYRKCLRFTFDFKKRGAAWNFHFFAGSLNCCWKTEIILTFF